jgi:Xaa-Pro aminopeptidase
MTPCTELMDRVRWIKTEAEVALIRRAADLLDDAYLETFQAYPGGRYRTKGSR